VRPVRLAAAGLAEPFGALSITVAAAQALPATLSPVLGLVGFSPFGSLSGVPAERAQGTSAVDGTRRPAPSGGSPGAVAAALVAESVKAAGAAIPGTTGKTVANQVADTISAGAEAADIIGKLLAGQGLAGATGAAGSAAAPAPARTQAPELPSSAPAVAEILGTLIDSVERLPVVGPTMSRAAAAVRPQAPAAAASGSNTTVGDGTIVGDVLAVTSEIAGKAIRSAGAAVPGTTAKVIADEVAIAVSAAISPEQTMFDQAMAQLRATEALVLGASVGAAGRRTNGAASPQAAAGAQAPRANGQPAPAAAANGAAGAPAQAVAPEPGELAWLVNEALIEQARRHGMDLS